MPGSLGHTDQPHQHQVFEGDIGAVGFVLAKWTSKTNGKNQESPYLNLVDTIPHEPSDFECELSLRGEFSGTLIVGREDLAIVLVKVATVCIWEDLTLDIPTSRPANWGGGECQLAYLGCSRNLSHIYPTRNRASCALVLEDLLSRTLEARVGQIDSINQPYTPEFDSAFRPALLPIRALVPCLRDPHKMGGAVGCDGSCRKLW